MWKKKLSSIIIADKPEGLVFEDQFDRIFGHKYPSHNWQQLYEKFGEIAALLSWSSMLKKAKPTYEIP